MGLTLKVTQQVTQLDVTDVKVTELVVAPFDVAAGAIPKSIGDAKGDLVGFSAADTPVRIPAPPGDGYVPQSDSGETSGIKWVLAALARKTWVVAISSTGDMGALYFPSNVTIKRVTLLGHGGAAGSVVVDLRKETYANYSTTQPDSGDSICASTKPTISAAYKSQDATLSGWTTSISAGDVLQAYCESMSTFTWVELLLEFE